MRRYLLTFIHLLFFSYVNSQISYSNVETGLKKVAASNETKLICTWPSFSVEFKLASNSIEIKGNYTLIDSQVIQVTPLKVNGSKKSLVTLDTMEQKKILADYSKYELDYLTKDLHVEIINPNNQWVGINSKKWFIWYFKMGSSPVQVERKTDIQLYASTIVGENILTINAPVLTGGDFRKAGLIVNQMMESLMIIPK